MEQFYQQFKRTSQTDGTPLAQVARLSLSQLAALRSTLSWGTWAAPEPDAAPAQ